MPTETRYCESTCDKSEFSTMETMKPTTAQARNTAAAPPTPHSARCFHSDGMPARGAFSPLAGVTLRRSQTLTPSDSAKRALTMYAVRRILSMSKRA